MSIIMVEVNKIEEKVFDCIFKGYEDKLRFVKGLFVDNKHCYLVSISNMLRNPIEIAWDGIEFPIFLYVKQCSLGKWECILRTSTTEEWKLESFVDVSRVKRAVGRKIIKLAKQAFIGKHAKWFDIKCSMAEWPSINESKTTFLRINSIEELLIKVDMLT